jgi:hypothetical protein
MLDACLKSGQVLRMRLKLRRNLLCKDVMMITMINVQKPPCGCCRIVVLPEIAMKLQQTLESLKVTCERTKVRAEVKQGEPFPQILIKLCHRPQQ